MKIKKIDSSKYKDSGEFLERLEYANISLIESTEKDILINCVNNWLNQKITKYFHFLYRLQTCTLILHS
jgi:hypothetical protein